MRGQAGSQSDPRSLFVRAANTPMRDAIRLRLSGRLDYRHHIETSGLPAPLAGLVLRIVRATRLWRIEKVDVASELISHFAEGVSSGGSTEKLMQDFGNPDQAARLIRRAKKRNRPAWWKSARYAAFSVIALISIYLLLIGYFALGRPTIATDYVAILNERAAAVAPDDRAWPLYRSALLAMEELPEALAESWPALTDDNREALTPYVRRNAQACDLARQAARRPALGFLVGYTVREEDKALWPEASSDPGSGLMHVQLPHLASMRRLAMLLEAESHIAAEEGDGQRIIDNALTMMRMASHIREHSFIISDLVNIAIAARAFHLLADHLFEYPELFTDEMLRDLAHGISSAASDGNFRIQLEGERMFFADILQRLYTDDGRGGGRWTPQGLRYLKHLEGAVGTGNDDSETPTIRLASFAVAPAVGIAVANRREMMAKYDEFYAVLVQEVNAPLWQQPSSGFDHLLSQMFSSNYYRVRYLPIGLLMPAVARAGINGQLAAQQRDGILIAIALELYRRHHGDWPESLDHLAPRYLPAVPIDRFDGKPMRYTIREGRPIVYSIGTNHEDNGGTPAVNSGGEPQSDAAMRWMHPDGVENRRQAQSHFPEGDWIIWPRDVTWFTPEPEPDPYPYP